MIVHELSKNKHLKGQDCTIKIKIKSLKITFLKQNYFSVFK